MVDDRAARIAEGSRKGLPRRDGRTAAGDGAPLSVTSGERSGTSGAAAALRSAARDLGRRLREAHRDDLGRVLLIVAPVSLIVCTVNSLTHIADFPNIAPWEAWTWEASSLISLLLVLVFPWLATTIAPPDEAAGEGWRPKARFAAVHLTGLLAFSLLHVAGFVLLRSLVYDLMEAGPYVFGDRFVYELRKDLLTYAAYVAAFWFVAYLRRRRDEPVRPVSFDIRDGARIIRTPLTDILAVSSAGNYVEFWLADGRRPLMRATLAAVERELGPFDFIRAHRSWLVNAGRMTGLRPHGSGDWTIELHGVEAPLSRRFPEALERLKARV